MAWRRFSLNTGVNAPINGFLRSIPGILSLMPSQDDAEYSYRVQGPSTPPTEPREPVTYEFSVEESRELDHRAVHDYGIPSILLMENAAIGLCHHALQMIGEVAHPSVLIFCGPGNNGGDGFALARHLHNHSIPVSVVATNASELYSGDACTNLAILDAMGIEFQLAQEFFSDQRPSSHALIVDALFGTGLTRPVEGVSGDLIDWINTTRARSVSRVLAVDSPSGLDLQTGTPIGSRVVRADATATFAGLKPGMSRMEAIEYMGEVHVVPIGVPRQLLEELGRPIEPKRSR